MGSTSAWSAGTGARQPARSRRWAPSGGLCLERGRAGPQLAWGLCACARRV